nr:E3 ubiquitin-protein ligase SINAT2-like [Tanacetum cinerariifolium]
MCASLLCESSTQSKPSEFNLKSCPLVLKPKTFKLTGGDEIAKVEFRCVLGCDIVLDSRSSGEEGEQCIRYLALEKVAEPLNIAYDCPYPGSKCLVREGISSLVEDLKDDHDVGIYDTYRFNHCRVQSYSNKMENANGISVAVFSCYGVQFCYHLKDFLLGITPCYIAFLRFMGEDIEAKRFNYVLRLVGDDQVLQWQGVPRSLRDNLDKVRDDLDGLVIPRNLASLFSNGNGKELC